MNKLVVIKKAVSMYPEEWGIVERVDQQYGLANTSAALRHIVNDWERRQSQECRPQQASKPEGVIGG